MWPWAYAKILIFSLFLWNSVAFFATRLSRTPFQTAKDRNYVANQFTLHVFECNHIKCGAVADADVSLGARPHPQQGERHH